MAGFNRRPSNAGKMRIRRGKKVLTSEKMRKLKDDQMLNMAELARRSRMRPENLRNFYSATERNERLERVRHTDKHDKIREALFNHAVFILQLIGEVDIPKIPGTYQKIEIKREDKKIWKAVGRSKMKK